MSIKKAAILILSSGKFPRNFNQVENTPIFQHVPTRNNQRVISRGTKWTNEKKIKEKKVEKQRTKRRNTMFRNRKERGEEEEEEEKKTAAEAVDKRGERG